MNVLKEKSSFKAVKKKQVNAIEIIQKFLIVKLFSTQGHSSLTAFTKIPKSMTDPFYQNQQAAGVNPAPQAGAMPPQAGQNPQMQQAAPQGQQPAQAAQVPQQPVQQVPGGAAMPGQVAPQQATPQQVQAQLQAIQAQQAAQQEAELKQKLATLAQQEQTLRQQLQQLNAVWQNPQLTPEQRQQVQVQGTQLNQQLAALLQKKAELEGTLKKGVVKPKIKKGSKISMKGFLIGCGVFLLLLLGGAAGIFYTFVQDPDRIASMGLTMDTATQLLKAFVSVFFGLLVFAGFGMLVVNIYRLISSKNKRKGGYVGGTILGLIILIGGAAGWVTSLGRIGSISPETTFDANRLITSYIRLWGTNEDSTAPKRYINDGTVPLIAPATMSYQLNGTMFSSQILNRLGPIDGTKLEINLHCGNGKTVPLNLQNLSFQDTCFFTEKGTYQQTLEVNYVNAQTQERLQQNIEAGTITFASEISITSTEGAEVNEAGTEINLGKIPSKVTLNATSLFNDLGLTNYVINWDVDTE